MKVSNKLFKKMEKCCELRNQSRVLSNEIDEELKSMGIDIDEMRDKDVVLADFIDYGEYVQREKVEEALDKFPLIEKKGCGKKFFTRRDGNGFNVENDKNNNSPKVLLICGNNLTHTLCKKCVKEQKTEGGGE